MMSYDMVDARSKLPLAMEDLNSEGLNSEDEVSNVSSFDSISQDYPSAARGSTMSRTQAYSVKSPHKSSHQLQENQNSEPRILNFSHKKARNRKSAAKSVVSLQTRARWAMLRSLVGAAEAEEETETGEDSGNPDHEIESDLQSGEPGYQASEDNFSREESELCRPQVPGIAVIPSGQSVASEMLTTSRDLLADSPRSATNDTATIERYLHNLSKDPRIDIRGLSASLPGERIGSVEKDFKALAGHVENVLRADAQGVKRIAHVGNERVENAVDLASVRGVEQALHAGGERIENAADSFGERGGKALEKDAHEIKKAFEKEEGSMEAHRLEQNLHAGAEKINNAVGSFWKRVGNDLGEHDHEIKRAVEKEEGWSMGAHGLERAFHVEGERIKNDAGSLVNRAGKALEEDTHETKKVFEKGEGLLTGVHGLEQAIRTNGQELSNSIGDFGRNTGKVLGKEAYEIKQSLGKEEGLITGAHGLERAIYTKGQEIRNDIGDSGRYTGEVLRKEAHEIKKNLDKEVNSMTGTHTPQVSAEGRTHASQPLRTISPSVGSKINASHQQKQMAFPNSYGLPPGAEQSHSQKQSSLVNAPRPRTPSTEPQAFTQPQRHMNLPSSTRSPSPSPNQQVQNPHSKEPINIPGSLRPIPHSAALERDNHPPIPMNPSNPLAFNASHPNLLTQAPVQGPPITKPPFHNSERNPSNPPPSVSHKQVPPAPLSVIDPTGNSRPALNTNAREPRPVSPSLIALQQRPISHPPADGPRNQQVNNTHIPTPQPSQNLAIPPQKEQFPRPPNNGAASHPANNSQDPHARPPVPSQGPAPRNQQVPSSTPSPSGRTIVEPTKIINPPLQRPPSPLPGPGSRLQQHLLPTPSKSSPIIQPSNKSHLPPTSALYPLPAQLPRPLDNQMQASQTLEAQSSRVLTADTYPKVPQTPQAGPPSHESVVVIPQAPMSRVPQPIANQSKYMSNNSLQPSNSDLHLMQTEQPTGSAQPSVSLAPNQDTCEGSRLQFHVQDDFSTRQDSQPNLRRHQSPSNASLKSSDSSQRDSSALSTSTEYTIPQQSTASTEPPSSTTAPHPLANAFEHVIAGFKRRSEAGIAAGCSEHPGFLDMMVGLLVKVGEDALPVIQQRLEENQRCG